MSMPPQGGWPTNQGPPQYGLPPQPPPPGWQQGPWPQSPPPPNNTVKWLLIAVAVLLVVAVSIGATLLFTRDDSGGGRSAGPSFSVPSDIASANDTGPVAIITDDPTCQPYYAINNGLAGVEANGWSDQRATLGPVASWTPEQRAQAQAVATAMRNASDQSVALAKQTPHRVVRELYDQFIAYGRAYADSVSTFTPADNSLADAQVSFGTALIGICNVIKYQSSGRSIGIEAAAAPTDIGAIVDPASAQRFMGSSDPSCDVWIANSQNFDSATAAWQKLDTNVSGPQWTPEQRTTQLDALPAITTFADQMESVGRRSKNPVFEDFAVVSGLYLRAYAAAGDTYNPADSWLSNTATRVNNGILGACRSLKN